MEMIKMSTIQKYYGQAEDGTNWFIWDTITVPKYQEHNVCVMNELIPKLFQLPEMVRRNILDEILLKKHNKGINQYYPFLKDYASKEVAEFITEATASNTQKVK